MADFHTIRVNGPDYLLFLQAKVNLISELRKDLQNNDVFHLIVTKFSQGGLEILKDIEEK